MNNASAMTSVPILAPKILYGTALRTRAAWRRFLNENGEDLDKWRLGLRGLELSQICLQDRIILSDSTGLTSRKESHWRLFWVWKLFQRRWTGTSDESLAIVRRQQE